MTTSVFMTFFGIMTFISVILLMTTILFSNLSNKNYNKIVFSEASMGIVFLMLFAISVIIHRSL